MTLKTFIFIGRSGSGKGTQADLLQDYLKKNDSENPVLYVETGAKFREFWKEDSYTSKLSGKLNEEGKIQPSFLAVSMWTSALRESFKGNEHLIFDGTPRKIREAHVLEHALEFYGRNDNFIIYPNVSREWSKERLLERGRNDDNLEDIEERLNWYDSDVAPIVEYFKENPLYKFIDVNGEQTIEEVHKEIINKTFK